MIEKQAKFVDGKQVVLDTSSITTAQQCGQKYKYAVLERFGPKDLGSSVKTVWGHAMHHSVETYYKALFHGASHIEATKEAVKAATTYQEVLSQGEQTDNTRTFSTLIRAVIWYTAQWENENCKTVALPNGDPAIEVRFEVPLPGTPYRESGRIDRIFEMEGLFYIADLKTTSTTLSTYYFNNYRTDNQIYTYLWAARNLFGIPISGFFIDGVQTLVGSTRFGRAFFDVSNAQIDEWMNSIKYTVSEIEKWHETGFFPMRFSSCGMYGGCPFNRLCSIHPEHRPNFLEKEYVKRERS